MPATVTTIDRDQRVGLYELVRNHLGSIEDFFVALERTKDFAKAERLGLEFAEDFRLLQDIGWAERDEREEFELTMPVHNLMELLQRLRAEAVPILVESGAEAESSREDAKTDRRFQLGYEVCNLRGESLGRGGWRDEFARRLLAIGLVDRSDTPLREAGRPSHVRQADAAWDQSRTTL